MDENKKAIINRMKRIEGQIKGIEKMVDEEKFCGDILIQISAARSALNKVGGLILENYTSTCIKNRMNNIDSDEALNELIDIIIKYTK